MNTTAVGNEGLADITSFLERRDSSDGNIFHTPGSGVAGDEPRSPEERLSVLEAKMKELTRLKDLLVLNEGVSKVVNESAGLVRELLLKAAVAPELHELVVQRANEQAVEFVIATVTRTLRLAIGVTLFSSVLVLLLCTWLVLNPGWVAILPGSWRL